jgi:hypothetical protein
LRQSPSDIDRICIFGIVRKDIKQEHPRYTKDEMLSVSQTVTCSFITRGHVPRCNYPFLKR